MAAVSCTLSEEQFLCSICLEVFTDPVTTPCGHSFCRVCINKHWDSSDQYNCPVCQQDFSSRPQMKINTVLAEMVSQFRNKPEDEETVSSKPQSTAPGEVSCDVCPEPRLRALKSCLVCLASYCQIHLQPHLTNPRLKRHQLIQPLPNLEERICPEHDRPLELFCREHSHFMCMQCGYTEHQTHDTVPLKEEGEEHQATLKNQIKERRQKIEEIRRSVELSQRKADTEIQEGLRVYNALMECVQQSLDKFKQNIVEKHKKNEEEAAQLIEQIQTEISALEQRGAEMEQLWSSGDHLHFVQTFTSVKPAPQLNDWTEETVRAPSYKGRAGQALSDLKKTLNTEMEKFFKTELEKVQEFAVEVSLDPDTAHPKLVLSKDLKQVHYRNQRQTLPDNPERFSRFFCVLGKQKFSSEKFYFEVQVKGKTQWELGVAKESVDRKAEDDQTVQRGYWTLYIGRAKYITSDDPPVLFPVTSSPEKVGVFVDYDEGLVSFYDVDEESLIYSFTDCGFTENIRPLLIPYGNAKGTNSAPLILSPINSSAE
ncbi:E3 ubiquitin-protein ligase TRIM21-like [Boleophthalmus pectinirostris]|uniref:E3 ubiquitin-protein ligase TRIM21-like n=1 Tax=Boleophthalmus pectinirostris TaxID=150288 RepID=UPI00243250CE|nr:E3 ubiquitin-protein ligase TRIM21-like [Boleophthalmus pectinirostris]